MARNFFFDWIAPVYERFAPPRAEDGLLGILKLPAKGRFFEAGGGTGRIAAGFAPYIDFIAVGDLSFPMLCQAKRKPNLYVLQHQVENLPFKEQTFDRVLVVDAFHHFNQQETALMELLRVLKNGGRLVIEEPNIESFTVKLIAWGEQALQMDSRILSAQQIQALCERGGYPIMIYKEKYSIYVVIDKEQLHHHV